MRILAVVALLAAALSGAAAAQGTPVPPGSYLATCDSAEIDSRGALKAECRDDRGRWRQARLADVADCLGDIRNRNGRLDCVRRSKLPPGLWTGACRFFEVDGRTLSAECRRRNGRFRSARIEFAGCKAGLVVRDGRLLCDTPRNRPAGSWIRACRSFDLRRGEFAADCASRRGAWAWTSLRADACPTGFAVAADGRLICERPPFVPPGAWARTCPSFQVVGDRLSAVCRDWRGRDRQARIDWRRCRGSISNVNGALVCDRDIERTRIEIPIPIPAAARPFVPPGDWHRVCRRGAVIGGRLEAECRDERGRARRSSLAWRECEGYVTAWDGRLVCSEDAGEPEYALIPIEVTRPSRDVWVPEGSWRESCRAAYVYGPWLYAACLDWSGAWRPTSIEYGSCWTDVWNYDGELYCDATWEAAWNDRRTPIPLPPGSWTESCRAAAYDGFRLAAECRDDRGRFQRSFIDVRSCPYPISNRDGDLICGEPRLSVPDGSYLGSCRNADFDGLVLRAECADRRGRWVRAAIDVRTCPYDIANRDGDLVCDAPEAPLPVGSWASSCRDPSFDGRMLRAVCATAGGGEAATEIDAAACPSTISNQDGRLACDAEILAAARAEAVGLELPPGSYRETCRNGVASLEYLTAECLNAAGVYVPAGIAWRQCQGDLANQDGVLVCAGVEPLAPPPPPLPAAHIRPPAGT